MSSVLDLKGTTQSKFFIGPKGANLVIDTSNYTTVHSWILPNSDGASGSILITDGAGNLSWETTVPTNHGGTGLTSIGTANQVLGVNAAASGLEYKTIAAGTGVSITDAANLITIDSTKWSGTFSQLSGTTSIPADNSTPLVTEGTQIMTQTLTPKSVNSQFTIMASAMIDCSSAGDWVTIAVFRGNTCIGVQEVESIPALLGLTPTHGYNMALVVNDSPATASSITYSMRIGRYNGGTWYLNQLSGATFGGAVNNGWIIQEF